MNVKTLIVLVMRSLVTRSLGTQAESNTPWSAAAWDRFGPRRPGAAGSGSAQLMKNVTARTGSKRRLAGALQGVRFASVARATSKHGWIIGFLLVGVWLVGGAAAVRGQSPVDGFNPNANGAIRVVVVQPDGKILIGGDFTTLAPEQTVTVTRNHIARLNPDGTVDSVFNPNASSFVTAIAVQADGKILVGGDFNGANSIGGQSRNYIARLDALTGSADSFNPNANSFVLSIAVQTDGKIVVGGDFSGANSIGGQTRNRLARLDATTGLADSFNPNANGYVAAMVLQADGKILVGGIFNNISGQTRNRIARLDAATGLPDSFNPNANNAVRTIAIQADGKILVGGFFNGVNSIGGQVRNRIARLNPTTGLADSFNPNANSFVNTIAVQADGKILAGGDFNGANSIGGQTRTRIARLDPTTGLADSFDAGADNDVLSIAVQTDGKVLAGGDFTFITVFLPPNGSLSVSRNSIARLETDGRLDLSLNLSGEGNYIFATAIQPDGKSLLGGFFSAHNGTYTNMARLNTDGLLESAFNPNPSGEVKAIAVQTDGKILAGGFFGSIGGQTRNHIARLNAINGAADSFNPNADGFVRSIAVQADGKILVGGEFTHIGGQTRNYIARLDPITGLADSFNPNADAPIDVIALQADGKILVGGEFFSIGGQTRNYFARLDAATGLADSFTPNASGAPLSIVVQPDGKILVGGYLSSIGGQTRHWIARLDPTTGLADSFNPNANGLVTAIAVQADGKILVGGFFNGVNSIGGQTRNFIARLDGTTGLADSFEPDASESVDSIALGADGKVLLGGSFSSIGGLPHNLVARLSNDTAALQNIAVTQATITWTRAGSSPQFTRVTFEYSDDNVIYTPLGNGTAVGSNWTRTGLSLSTGQNIYIRARGYYRSGYGNGSSIIESVRNAFLAGPTAADATISGQILANDGAPIPGAIVNLAGTQTRKTITDASGNYHFDHVETSGFYTLTPSRTNYTFGPTSHSFSQLGNTTEAVFTGTSNVVVVGNPVDTPEYFVRQHYLDFLGREPDEAGFNFWSDQLRSCGSDTGCLERRRINVSAAYFLSIEFQQTGGLVDGLYRASYGRRPLYAEFVPDAGAIAQNVVVGRNGWETQLESNKAAFVDAWVQREAFVGVYANVTNDSYVDQLIRNTGVNYASSERDALVDGLANGTLTRSAALRQIIENQSFVRAKFNQTFVMMQYFGYLRRDPDASGYQFWLGKLNKFNGNFEQAEMVKAFISSVEYCQRFGSP